MGFLDKAKAAAETAVAKTKDAAEDVQQKRDLSSTYNDLGKTTFDLIEAGEISHASLDEYVAKIKDLKEKIAGDAVLVGATAGSDSEEYDDSQPPAMPS
jgi:hypothetical protein